MVDQNFLLNLEREIIKKYGEEAVKNPKANWTNEKEQDYLKQIRENTSFYEEKQEQIEIDGVLIPKKLITKKNDRICLGCNKYSHKKDDDLYLNRFKCCFICFINFVEGREQKWLNKISLEKDLKK